jgi:hypothetical protein
MQDIISKTFLPPPNDILSKVGIRHTVSKHNIPNDTHCEEDAPYVAKIQYKIKHMKWLNNEQ